MHPSSLFRSSFGFLSTVAIATFFVFCFFVPFSDAAVFPYRASVASDGTQASGSSGNDFPSSQSISPDGRYVVFEHDAPNLVSGDSNGVLDLFIHDITTGTTERVNVASDGSQSTYVPFAFHDFLAKVTPDGRYVVFTSRAPDLVPSDTNGWDDVFIRDRLTGITERVSVATDGTESNGRSDSVAISDDGRYVVFRSVSSSLVPEDTDGLDQLFIRDRILGTTEMLFPGTGYYAHAPVEMSGDGRYVAFVSPDPLIPEDTNGTTDAYVYDRDTDTLERVSVLSDGSQGTGGSVEFQSMSSDAHFVMFRSDMPDLVSDDTNGFYDVFVHDRVTHITERVSIATDGTEGDNNAGGGSISDNGQFVIFFGPLNLIPEEEPEAQIFVHDRSNGTTKGLYAGPIAVGRSITADGSLVVSYSSQSNLVPNDTNGVIDVFVTLNPLSTTINQPPVLDPIGPQNGVVGGLLEFTVTATDINVGDTLTFSATNLPTGATFDPETATFTWVPTGTGSRTDVEFRVTDNGDPIGTDFEIVTITIDMNPTFPEPVELISATLNGWLPWSDFSGRPSSESPVISEDGTLIAFTSSVSNLVEGDTNGVRDVFLYDRSGDSMERIDMSFEGEEIAEGVARGIDMSNDGRYLVYSSASQEIVSEGPFSALNIYVYDRQTGITELVDLFRELAPSTDFNEPKISDDGRYIAFWSDGYYLVPDDTNFLTDIFVHDRQTGETQRVSIASDGTEADAATSGWFDMSADGSFIVFDSLATNLVPNDTNGVRDVFVRDVQAGTTERISVSSFEEQADNQSSRPFISGDGRFVSFQSSGTNVIPDDTNNVADVFLRDMVDGTTERVSVLTGGGERSSTVRTPNMVSYSGRYVFFVGDSISGTEPPLNRDLYVHDRVTGITEAVFTRYNGEGGNPNLRTNSVTDISLSKDERYISVAAPADSVLPVDSGKGTRAQDILVIPNPFFSDLPTTMGSEVVVDGTFASVFFDTVSSEGTTQFTPILPEDAGTIPGAYSIVEGSMAYEITTTAGYTGPLIVFFRVPQVNDEALFNTLRVLHNEGGTLIDRTILSPNTPPPDFANRTLYALVDSLSPFVIVSLTGEIEPEPLELITTADSFLRHGNPDRDEGANPMLRIQASGDNRIVTAFDAEAIENFGSVSRATLILSIGENADNWGTQNNRTVDAHPLLVPFTEGNGQNAGVPGSVSTRGTGSGVTWNCATDTAIENQQTNCNPQWDGGSYGTATAPSQTHINGQTGAVGWDVTADVQAGITGWLIKKTNENLSGKVDYYSKEGATVVGTASFAPRLLLEP